MKTFIVNDGIDYYVVETMNASTAQELQESLQKGHYEHFNPIFRFTCLDKFRKK